MWVSTVSTWQNSLAISAGPYGSLSAHVHRENFTSTVKMGRSRFGAEISGFIK